MRRLQGQGNQQPARGRLQPGQETNRPCQHDPNGIECFLLIAFLAFNIFHALFALNLKP